VPIKLRVSRTVKEKGCGEVQEGREEVIEVHRFETTPAQVSVSYPLKLTKDYCSNGIDVTITIPCYVEEIEATIIKAKSMAAAVLREEFPKLQSNLNKLVEKVRGGGHSG